MIVGNSRRNKLGSLLLTTTGTLACFATASAQDRPPSPIVLGTPVDATLTPDDPIAGDNRYDSYRVRLALGQPVEIEMSAENMDAYLDIISPGLSEPLLSDDDSGGSLNARLRFPAPVAGDYVIRAQALNGATGDYRLTARTPAAPVEPPPPTLISAGTVSGTLGEASPLSDNDSPYDRYRFHADAGSRVRLDMKAIVPAGEESALDSRLTLRPENAASGFTASNDDSGGGTDASLLAIVPETGYYVVTAEGWPGNSGDYTLELRTMPAPAQVAAPIALTLGNAAERRLSLDDPDLRIGADQSGAAGYFYNLYSYEAAAGEEIVVDLRTDAFDPMLEAGVMSPLGFAVAESNDDFDGSLEHSRLVLRPEQAGTIYIRARSLGSGDLGDGGYSLNVTRPPDGE